MKITQKRGISDIITTVLIILLAIAAVVLIWGFIKRPIEQGGQQIQASGDCFSLKLKPTACVLNTTSKNIAATVQWAEGSVTLKSVKFVITDANGVTKVEDATLTNEKILETVSKQINVSSLNTSSLKLTAVGVIQPTGGQLTTCTTSQTETLACN